MGNFLVRHIYIVKIHEFFTNFPLIYIYFLTYLEVETDHFYYD